MSHSVNEATVLGRIGRDAELTYTPGGTGVAKFSVATSYKRGEEEFTEWHNVVLWDKVAESLAQYIKKGGLIYVRGRLQTRSWEKEGVKHYATEIIGERVVLCTSKGESGSSEPQQTRRGAPAANSGAAGRGRAAAPKAAPQSARFADDIAEDDIPF